MQKQDMTSLLDWVITALCKDSDEKFEIFLMFLKYWGGPVYRGFMKLLHKPLGKEKDIFLRGTWECVSSILDFNLFLVI